MGQAPPFIPERRYDEEAVEEEAVEI